LVLLNQRRQSRTKLIIIFRSINLHSKRLNYELIEADAPCPSDGGCFDS